MRGLLFLCPALLSGLITTTYASPVLDGKQQIRLQARNEQQQPSDKGPNESQRKPPPRLSPGRVEGLIQQGKYRYKPNDPNLPSYLQPIDPDNMEFLARFFKQILTGACKSCLRECIEERGLKLSYDCPNDCTNEVRQDWKPGTYKDEYRDGEDEHGESRMFRVPFAVGPMVNGWECNKAMGKEYGKIPDRPATSTEDEKRNNNNPDGPPQTNFVKLQPDSDLRRPYLTSSGGRSAPVTEIRTKLEVPAAVGGCKQFLANAKLSSLSGGCDIRPQQLVSQLGEVVKGAMAAPSPPKIPPFEMSAPAPLPKLGPLPLHVVIP